jgi:hypothetical protein
VAVSFFTNDGPETAAISETAEKNDHIAGFGHNNDKLYTIEKSDVCGRY